MKRNLIYLAALSALALTACSQDEAVNEIHPVNTDSSIGFRTNLDRSTVTRGANKMSLDSMKNFSVVALNEDNSTYFHKLTVNKSGTKEDGYKWTYEPVHYWPKNKGLRFFAAADFGSQGLTEKLNSTPLPGFSQFSPHNGGYTYHPTANKGQGVFGGSNNTIKHPHHDLIYAYYEGKYDNLGNNQGNTGLEHNSVELNFKHALAQIEVQAKNTNANREIEIIGVRIKNLKGRADGTFTGFQEAYPETITQQPNVTIEWNLGEETQTNTSDYFFRFPSVATTPAGVNPEVHVLDGKPLPDGVQGPLNIAPGNFNFMVIPQTTTAWAKTQGIDDNGGTYISVACRIYSVSTTTNGQGQQQTSKTLLYPKNDTSTDGTKLYGMAMVPVSFNLQAGNKYTYVLDFSKGSGQIDPEKPTEPEGGDIDDPGTGGGDEIDGYPIDFTVKVDQWLPGTIEGDQGGNIEM